MNKKLEARASRFGKANAKYIKGLKPAEILKCGFIDGYNQCAKETYEAAANLDWMPERVLVWLKGRME